MDFNKKRTELVNIAAEAAHDALSFDPLSAGFIGAIPDTEPQQYVVGGTLADIAAQLPKGAAGSACKLEGLTRGFDYKSGLDIKAVLYTDSINDKQVCRDDLWLATTAALKSLAAAGSDLKAMEERKDAAYYERNQVVAALAKCFPSGVAKTAIEGWSEDWHGCVYIDLPTGQVSWHFHDSQAHLFSGLPKYTSTWDGHDTPEKYRRVAALAAAGSASPAAAGLTDERIAELNREAQDQSISGIPPAIYLARAIEREVLAHAGVGAEPQRPVAALTDKGRAVKWNDNYATKPWVSAGYRPLYLATPSSDDVRNAWISVDERLPEDAAFVAIFDPENSELTVRTAQWLAGSCTFESEQGWLAKDEVSHWMPLPTPPTAAQSVTDAARKGGE